MAKTNTIDARIDDLATFEHTLHDDLLEVADAEAAHKATQLGVARLRAAVRQRYRGLDATVEAAVVQLAADPDADVLDAVIASAALTQADASLTAALGLAEAHAAQAVTFARSHAADTIAERLHGTIAELIDAARLVLTNLDGIADANDAVAAGPAAVEHWAQLLKLRDIHRRIRLAQLRALQADQPGMRQLEAKHWCALSWTLDVPGYGDDDGLALLRFLARDDVTAWVPTRAQLDADESEQRAAAKAEHDARQAEVHSLQGHGVSDRQIQAAANHHDVMSEADRQLFAQQSVTLGR